MSLQLYAPATKSGIIDLIYSNTGADTNKYSLMEVVRDVNLAIDKFLAIAIPASGKWQIDDSNQSDYPILTTNLVSGQRDYSFTVDGAGNLILDIYRVMVANSDGIFYDLKPVDQQTKGFGPGGMVDGQNRQGNPTMYDKTANGIFLDLIPDYNYSGGLKIFVNREATHFTIPTVNIADITKPGFAGLFHEYFALRPSYQFAYRKGLKNTSNLREEMLLMEQKIEEYYGQRNKDERPIMSGKKFNFR